MVLNGCQVQITQHKRPQGPELWNMRVRHFQKFKLAVGASVCLKGVCFFDNVVHSEPDFEKPLTQAPPAP